MESLRSPPEETGSVSVPPTEKWCSKKQNLEGDFSAAVFNFTLNNTESTLGFLQHLKLVWVLTIWQMFSSFPGSRLSQAAAGLWMAQICSEHQPSSATFKQ